MVETRITISVISAEPIPDNTSLAAISDLPDYPLVILDHEEKVISIEEAKNIAEARDMDIDYPLEDAEESS